MYFFTFLLGYMKYNIIPLSAHIKLYEKVKRI
jgi:hypothetical protein